MACSRADGREREAGGHVGRVVCAPHDALLATARRFRLCCGDMRPRPSVGPEVFLFCVSLGTAGGCGRRDSLNRRRSTLNRRRLALDRRQLMVSRRRFADDPLQPPAGALRRPVRPQAGVFFGGGGGGRKDTTDAANAAATRKNRVACGSWPCLGAHSPSHDRSV